MFVGIHDFHPLNMLSYYKDQPYSFHTKEQQQHFSKNATGVKESYIVDDTLPIICPIRHSL